MAWHARLPASQTKQWSNCPGSLAYVQAHEEYKDVSGVHAQMGTAAHALVERCLREGSEPEDYAGRLIEIIDPGGEEGTSILTASAKMPSDPSRVVFEVDQDMYEAVERMTTYVRGRCLELFDPPAALSAAAYTAELIRLGAVRLECRVNPLPERDDTGGTADVIIDAWPVLLEVVDYKNGSGVFVPVTGNEQLRSYGLGALVESDASPDYERVVYTICQPRHRQAPFDGIMSEEISLEDLYEWGEQLLDDAGTVDEAREYVAKGATLEKLFNLALLSVGEDGSHCRFCPLMRDCPAALAKAQETACQEFSDDPEPIDVPTGANHLSMVVPWLPFIDKWCKEVAAGSQNLLLAGGRIEGQKLVRGKSTRGWAESMEDEEGEDVEITEEDRVRMLVDDYGVDKEKLYTAPAEPKLITGPQAEKLVPKKLRAAFNKKLLHKPEGKLTMAAADDKRAEETVDPAADFPDKED